MRYVQHFGGGSGRVSPLRAATSSKFHWSSAQWSSSSRIKFLAALIFLGAGVLLLAEVVVRLLFASYRRPVLGTTILAIVFLGIGLGSWGAIWPLVLIVVGLALLLGGLFRTK